MAKANAGYEHKEEAAGYPAAPIRIDPKERELPDALDEQALRKPHRLDIHRPEIKFGGRPEILIAFENRQEIHMSLSSLKYMVKITLRDNKPPSGASLGSLYTLANDNVAVQKTNGCHRIGTCPHAQRHAIIRSPRKSGLDSL